MPPKKYSTKFNMCDIFKTQGIEGNFVNLSLLGKLAAFSMLKSEKIMLCFWDGKQSKDA